MSASSAGMSLSAARSGARSVSSPRREGIPCDPCRCVVLIRTSSPHLDRDVAEARVGGAVADAHELERLAFGAREEAVELPVVGDGVAASPEVRREGLERDTPAVPLDLAVPDHPRGLRGEVEV